MENQKRILILVLVFGLLMAGAFVLYDRLGSGNAPEQLATAPPESTGAAASVPQESTQASAPPAPDFTVYDRDGNAVRLSDFRGKPVVVNFWASWCGPCQSEMPDFEKVYQELGDEIHFLMVNMTDGSRETVQSASDFVAGEGYTFPVYFDTELQAALAYRVYSLPATYFIDAQGGAVTYATGAISEELLRIGIDLIR